MFTKSWFSIWASHMDLFVDIFFFMSAFLLSVLYLTELDKHYVSPWKLYVNRYLRLIPGYMAVVLFYATILYHIGDGPLWNFFMLEEKHSCSNYWWTNLFFMNNYIEKEHICLPQSWYLSCDFQLFLVGALLVVLFHVNQDTGLAISLAVLMASAIIVFFGTYIFNRPAMLIFNKAFWTDPRHNDMFSSVYSQGHYRGTSYLPGILAGFYVHRHNDKSMSTMKTYILQIGGLALILGVHFTGCLFYDDAMQYSRLFVSLYAALFHVIYGLGMALLVTSFTLGTTTPLARAFSWSGFVPVGKLTFSIYLIHFVFPYMWIASSRTTVYLNPIELVSWSIADMALSLVAAVVLCLTVETPVRYLIKHFIKKNDLSKKEKALQDPYIKSQP